jgi:hypothetical protein
VLSGALYERFGRLAGERARRRVNGTAS